MSTGYQPETPFQTDGGVVYNLQEYDRVHGKPRMCNDVCVSVQLWRRSDPILLREITGLIEDALNAKYPVQRTEEET